MGGLIGLDYGPLIALLNRQAPDPDDWQRMFDDVRAMEAEALDCMQRNTAS